MDLISITDTTMHIKPYIVRALINKSNKMRINDFSLYFVKYKPKSVKASNRIYGVHFNES